ncbi:MAG: putative lipoprotein [Myxococcaceae bacterium]|nr:putative lipoprotein [Myxococcaceae bacterium]
MILSLIITLATLGFTGFIMWKTVFPMLSNANRLIGQLGDQATERNRLLAQGAPGTARVVSLEGTGTLINNAPQVVLGLEVHPATGAAPFAARCISIVSQLQIPQVQPGCTVPVRFDPGNPSRIALAM